MLSMTKSKNIPIPSKKTSNSYTNYESKLDVNTFDPSKNSPPNEWLEKLQLRINGYYTIQEK